MRNQNQRRQLRVGNRPEGSSISPWVAIDSVLWVAVLPFAMWIRFDFSAEQLIQVLQEPRFYLVLAGLVILGAVFGWTSGLYRGRFVPGSLLETSTLTIVFVAATIIVLLAHIALGQFGGVPRSAPIIAGAFTVLASLTLRSTARRRELFGAGVVRDAEPVLVFGAGEGGLQLVRQLLRSEVSQFVPVGILDDDPSKKHMVIDGVKVYGDRALLTEAANKTGASTLIVAAPSLPAEHLIAIRDQAESAGLHVLVLPPLSSLMRGRDAINELREINVDDLLGRKPTRLNQTQIADYIRGKRVMVTGAGGSIGSELCRQLIRFRPAELMMLDRDESGLHAVQLSINDQAMLDGDDTILASIRDRDTIRSVFLERRPQIVFHAAALKHMPLLEQYPLEALKTNVMGTMNLLDAAGESGVETFVNISTDKAANPTSVLGTSKRIAERLTTGKSITEKSMKSVSVRFGNVLGSRGSVLTVFEEQIRRGGPVTVTDPNVSRYFMTIPEACQLVLQAAAVGQTGETLVLDMGEPVKIAEVARTLIEQSGKKIEIVYTGLRQNEKLSEELFDRTETDQAGQHHPALSTVSVPPVYPSRSTIESLADPTAARIWMSDLLYAVEE